MKKKSLLKRKYILPAFLLLLLVGGCFKDREVLFEHQLLEWEPPNRATNALSMEIDLDAGETEAQTFSLRIQYAGPHVSNEIKGVFEVYAAETTAVEGQHFRIVGEKTVRIPPNSSHSEEIEIEILSDAVLDGEELEAVLRITEASDVQPMENYRNFVIEISKDE